MDKDGPLKKHLEKWEDTSLGHVLARSAEAREHFTTESGIPVRIESLLPYTPLADLIEDFWLDPQNTEGPTWTEHREINMVMLAASLSPDGYLGI